MKKNINIILAILILSSTIINICLIFNFFGLQVQIDGFCGLGTLIWLLSIYIMPVIVVIALVLFFIIINSTVKKKIVSGYLLFFSLFIILINTIFGYYKFKITRPGYICPEQFIHVEK